MPHSTTAVVTVFIFLGFFSMVSFTVWVLANGRRRREQMRVMNELTTRLLDRVSSAGDFGEFLKSESGARLLEGLTREADVNPGAGILSTLRVGIVLIALSSGLLLVHWTITTDTAFAILGVIALSLGLGFLIASLASLRLARKLGLLRPPADRHESR